MRMASIIVICIAGISYVALAHASPVSDPTNNPAANSEASNPTTAPPQSQPQGDPGPINTTSGGAPASSPQGDSPPGMQPNSNNRKQDADSKR